jgi:hypothetical protein
MLGHVRAVRPCYYLLGQGMPVQDMLARAGPVSSD